MHGVLWVCTNHTCGLIEQEFFVDVTFKWINADWSAFWNLKTAIERAHQVQLINNELLLKICTIKQQYEIKADWSVFQKLKAWYNILKVMMVLHDTNTMCHEELLITNGFTNRFYNVGIVRQVAHFNFITILSIAEPFHKHLNHFIVIKSRVEKWPWLCIHLHKNRAGKKITTPLPKNEFSLKLCIHFNFLFRLTYIVKSL